MELSPSGFNKENGRFFAESSGLANQARQSRQSIKKTGATPKTRGPESEIPNDYLPGPLYPGEECKFEEPYRGQSQTIDVNQNKLEMGYPFNSKLSDIVGLANPGEEQSNLNTLDYLNAGGDDQTPEQGARPQESPTNKHNTMGDSRDRQKSFKSLNTDQNEGEKLMRNSGLPTSTFDLLN